MMRGEDVVVGDGKLFLVSRSTTGELISMHALWPAAIRRGVA
jgi:hypothetical protein